MTVKRPCWQIVTGIVSDNPYEPPWRSSNNSILEVSKLWLVQSQLWRQFGFKRLVGEDWWLKVWKEDKGSSWCIIGPGLCRARMRYEPLGGEPPGHLTSVPQKPQHQPHSGDLTFCIALLDRHCVQGMTSCCYAVCIVNSFNMWNILNPAHIRHDIIAFGPTQPKELCLIIWVFIFFCSWPRSNLWQTRRGREHTRTVLFM